MNKNRRKAYTLIEFLVTIIIIALILWGYTFVVSKIKRTATIIPCQKNLGVLYGALREYAADSNGLYPDPSKWCDLLVEKEGIDRDKFWCRSVGYTVTDAPIEETNRPIEIRFVYDYNDEKGQKKYVYDIQGSNYALNPNADPNSVPSVVLLFETEHSWNRFGESELVSVKNHLEVYGKEGCNVLFNDGRVKFVNPKDIPKLNWGKPPADSDQPPAK